MLKIRCRGFRGELENFFLPSSVTGRGFREDGRLWSSSAWSSSSSGGDAGTGSSRAYMRSFKNNHVVPLRTCSSSHLLDLQTLRRRKQRNPSTWAVRRRAAPSVDYEHVRRQQRRRPARLVSCPQEQYRAFGSSATDLDKKKETTTRSTKASSSSSSAVSTSDPPVWTWVDRVLPLQWQPYARLARLDKPIGTMLLVRTRSSMIE